jgi:hypothetical protein
LQIYTANVLRTQGGEWPFSCVRKRHPFSVCEFTGAASPFRPASVEGPARVAAQTFALEPHVAGEPGAAPVQPDAPDAAPVPASAPASAVEALVLAVPELVAHVVQAPGVREPAVDGQVAAPVAALPGALVAAAVAQAAQSFPAFHAPRVHSPVAEVVAARPAVFRESG